MFLFVIDNTKLFACKCIDNDFFRYIYVRKIIFPMEYNRFFIVLLKKPSTILSHDPCLGVNTNSNLSGPVDRYFLTASDV